MGNVQISDKDLSLLFVTTLILGALFTVAVSIQNQMVVPLLGTYFGLGVLVSVVNLRLYVFILKSGVSNRRSSSAFALLLVLVKFPLLILFFFWVSSIGDQELISALIGAGIFIPAGLLLPAVKKIITS